jgi:hypothetical protein
MNPRVGLSKSAIRATVMAMVMGTRISVSQKREVSVVPRVNTAMTETKTIKNQIGAGNPDAVSEVGKMDEETSVFLKTNLKYL